MASENPPGRPRLLDRRTRAGKIFARLDVRGLTPPQRATAKAAALALAEVLTTTDPDRALDLTEKAQRLLNRLPPAATEGSLGPTAGSGLAMALADVTGGPS